MKKQIFLNLLLLIIMLSSNAQNSLSFWSLSGNSNATSASKLGTTKAVDLKIYSNNIERMRINSAGNVYVAKTFYGLGNGVFVGRLGVGGPSTSSKFEVVGGDAIINGLTLGRGKAGILSNSAFGHQALFSNATGARNVANGHQSLYSNNTGGDNTAIGHQALFFNTLAFGNTATGSNSLYKNTTGYQNTANGSYALENNITGSTNTAVGSYALKRNNEGSGNTSIGHNTLYYNTTGTLNSALGHSALHYNTDGHINTAVGNFALGGNTAGDGNTAIGAGAMYTNTDGNWNTAVGNSSLSGITTGNYNTGIGYQTSSGEDTHYSTAVGSMAGVSSGLINATALGSGAVVNASNKVRIGNINVTVVELAGGSWTVSDGRFKNNIKEDVKGLEFINLLRTVVYNFDADKYQDFILKEYPDSIKTRNKAIRNKSRSEVIDIVQTGLIAQEVEIAAKKSGYNFNGVHAPENATDNYSLSYEKLVVPLIKAVQELSHENEILKAQLDKLEKMLTKQPETPASFSDAKLGQNYPNPYSQETSINYYVPPTTSTAVLKISDTKGSVLKTLQLKKGMNQVKIQASQLAKGIYYYSLFTDGRLYEAKQMIQLK